MTAETKYAAKVASTVTARSEIGVNAITGTYEWAEALEVNDIVQMVKVPKGAKIIDVILGTDDLDTATGNTLSVGDGTTADRFITASTVSQAGGIVRMSNIGGMGYVYTADDTIDIKVIAVGTSATSGTMVLTVLYEVGAVA